MPIKKCLYLLCCVVLLSGCRQYGVLVKRESELKSPTDIRQTVPWCAGEDSLFRYPCGPNEQFHGHKPTCWRPWQSSGEEWRDLHCEPTACSECETGLAESFPVEEVSQPAEVLTPAQVGPVMSPPDSEEQEQTPLEVPPTGADELPLSEPEETLQQLGIPSDSTSYQIQPLLLDKQNPTFSSEQLFVDDSHQPKNLGNQAVSRLVVDKSLGQAELGFSPPLAVDPQSRNPVLLQPVELEKARIALKAMPLKIVTAPTEIPHPLAALPVATPMTPCENLPTQSPLWVVVRSETTPIREAVRSVSPEEPKISILEVVAENPSTKEPIRLMGLGTPKKTPDFKSLQHSKMIFVR